MDVMIEPGTALRALLLVGNHRLNADVGDESVVGLPAVDTPCELNIKIRIERNPRWRVTVVSCCDPLADSCFPRREQLCIRPYLKVS